jgi:hypothetical protein
MPLSEAGKKIRQNMHEEYGEKEGDRIFYSKENADKKFAQTVRASKKAQAEWWHARLEKLPIQIKSKIIGLLEVDQDVNWWLKRIKPIELNKAKYSKEGHTR